MGARSYLNEEAAKFEEAAQKHANAFWVLAVIAAAVWYWWGGWLVAIPVVLAASAAGLSVFCTFKSAKLRGPRSS